MHVYVYYDVPAERQRDVKAAVAAMHAALAADGVPCRAMRRPEARPDGSATWMEVYADVEPDFVERLHDAVETSGINAWTGPRHVERFVDA